MAKKRPVRPKQSKGNALDNYVVLDSLDGQHWCQVASGNDPRSVHALADRLHRMHRNRRYRIVRQDGSIAWRVGPGEIAPSDLWAFGDWGERHGRHEP